MASLKGQGVELGLERMAMLSFASLKHTIAAYSPKP